MTNEQLIKLRVVSHERTKRDAQDFARWWKEQTGKSCVIHKVGDTAPRNTDCYKPWSVRERGTNGEPN